MMNPAKKKLQKEPKHFTFGVTISFEMQYTFTEDEVERDVETDDGYEPTDKALSELEDEIKDYLSQNYAVMRVEAYADSDLLLGITSF
jgi:hypothetical protein